MEQGDGTPAIGAARPWQYAGLLLGPGLVYGYLIYSSLMSWQGSGTGGESGTGEWMGSSWYWLYATAYYAVGFAGWLFLVYRFVCRLPLANLNRKPGSLRTDIVAALLLFVVVFIACRLFHWFQYWPYLLESTGYVEQTAARTVLDPFSLFMQAVPYSFLAAGMMEEFNRAFLLERTWALWRSKHAQQAMIVVSAILFGLCHLYQGTSAVVGTGFFALIVALYYYYYGRILPMILAHGLYSCVLVIEWAFQV